MEGFFSPSEVAKEDPRKFSRDMCGKCGLRKKCESPELSVIGKGKKGIFIIGGPPGEKQDAAGDLTRGSSYSIMKAELERIGVSISRDCWYVSCILCAPQGKSKKGVLENYVEYCRPKILAIIEEYAPRTIITLGPLASRTVIEYHSGKKLGKFNRWIGEKIPIHKWGSHICPSFDPLFLQRKEDKFNYQLFRDYLERALIQEDLIADPLDGANIIIEQDPSAAAQYLRKRLRTTEKIAFDYECNCLKPYKERAMIYSCSVCFDGEDTIAFPYCGAAVSALKKVLRSPVPKIAANMKFEHKWTKVFLGFDIQNWVWDTMVAAHIINNESGITGLKFQAFAKLGVGDYNSHIEGWLSSDDEEGYNKIQKAPMADILYYNALDSLLEYALAEQQQKVMGY